MNIKICGITNLEDALNAVSFDIDALGFIFYPDSPRYISPDLVEEITMQLPPFVKTVGVFVNEDKEKIKAIVDQCNLDVVQLHGNESPGDCLDIPKRVIKAFRIQELEDIHAIAKYQGVISAALLDTKDPELQGGTGKTFDWGLALKAQEYDLPLILAGGINSANIQKAINLVNPYAIDIASSIESEPGKKDYNKMKELVQLAKSI
jgi:phosphoribosylanthranilate isomerase